MSTVKLTQSFINEKLVTPEGKSRVEYICDQLQNFFVEVRSTSPGVGTYYVRYRDPSNTTRYIKIGRTSQVSLADARAKAKVLISEIALGADPSAEAKAHKAIPTVAAYFEEHYLPYVQPRKRSYRRDEEMYRLRIKPAFGSKLLADVTRKQVQLFHTQLLESGLKPATADHYVKLMRHAFNLASKDWSIIKSNPLDRIPLFNADNRVENILNEEQLRTLVEVLRTDPNRNVCHIALFLLATGARLNEVLLAKHEQIDKLNRVWRIPATNSKSKRVRSVPLNISALEVLNDLDTEGTYQYLFVNRKTGLPYGRVHKAWHRIRAVAGVPFLRIHDLRHMYASFLVNSGRTLFEVQNILGHSDPMVTMRYAHLNSKSMQDAANSASVIIKAASTVPTEDEAPVVAKDPALKLVA
ncbi:MAG: tyrosine-type recombinase/integrase [Sterolibacterium sp.]